MNRCLLTHDYRLPIICIELGHVKKLIKSDLYHKLTICITHIMRFAATYIYIYIKHLLTTLALVNIRLNAFEQMASYLQALYRNESLQFIVILRKKKVLTSQKTQCLHYEDQLLRLRREIIAVAVRN